MGSPDDQARRRSLRVMCVIYLGFAMPITTAVQLPGPIAMAWVFDATGSYDAGLVSLSGVLVVAALLVRQVKLPEPAPAAAGAADAQASTA